MILDILHVLLASLILIFVMLGSAYWLCSIGNLLEYSRQQAFTRLALVWVLSIAIAPGVFYFLLRFGGTKSLYVWIGATSLASILLLVRDIRFRPFTLEPGISIGLLAVIGTILFLCIAGSLIDLVWNNRLYFSTVVYDWAGRVAVTQAVTDSGVPPYNPAFHPGHSLPLFYYYFWFLVGSVCQRLSFGLVNSRQALIAASFYAAIGLVSVTCLFLRFGANSSTASLSRRWRLGAIFLLVTGLDLVPWFIRNMAALLLHSSLHYREIESWNSQITAWTGTVLWVPNHVAGFVAAAFILLAVQQASNLTSKQATVLAIVAGFSFLSALGTSVWLGLMLAAILAAWFLFILFKNWRLDIRFLLITGMVAVLASLPFYFDLRNARHSTDRPLRFEVRQFFPAEALLRALHFSNPFAAELLNLLSLPLSYSLELGFFAVIAFLKFRQIRSQPSISREHYFQIVILLVTVCACSFVRSSLANNDFGWRAFMFAQLILLIWAVDLLADHGMKWQTNTGKFLLVTMWIGLLGSTADFLMLRFSAVAEDAFRPDNQIAQSARNFSQREIYNQINHLYPRTEFIQHNPEIEVDYYNSLFGRRPVVVADEFYSFLYGIDRSWANSYVQKLATPFTTKVPIDLHKFCAQYGIAGVAVRDTDPVWQDRSSWVWRQTPVLGNAFGRVFGCE